jgi:hypothetical protein
MRFTLQRKINSAKRILLTPFKMNEKNAAFAEEIEEGY